MAFNVKGPPNQHTFDKPEPDDRATCPGCRMWHSYSGKPRRPAYGGCHSMHCRAPTKPPICSKCGHPLPWEHPVRAEDVREAQERWSAYTKRPIPVNLAAEEQAMGRMRLEQ